MASGVFRGGVFHGGVFHVEEIRVEVVRVELRGKNDLPILLIERVIVWTFHSLESLSLIVGDSRITRYLLLIGLH